VQITQSPRAVSACVRDANRSTRAVSEPQLAGAAHERRRRQRYVLDNSNEEETRVRSTSVPSHHLRTTDSVTRVQHNQGAPCEQSWPGSTDGLASSFSLSGSQQVVPTQQLTRARDAASDGHAGAILRWSTTIAALAWPTGVGEGELRSGNPELDVGWQCSYRPPVEPLRSIKVGDKPCTCPTEWSVLTRAEWQLQGGQADDWRWRCVCVL
jgi:hypothetical protein